MLKKPAPKRPHGRPMKINPTLVNAICYAVENEMLTHKQICDRFNIHPITFRQWVELGQQMIDGEVDDTGVRSTLSRQLTEQLNEIYAEHEKKLIDRIQQPEFLEIARLALCVNPNISVLESAAQ